MIRPNGWKANPQAMAAASKKPRFSGHPDLQTCDNDGDTFLTPKFITSQLGTFDLDPCAATQNPQWICKRYFTSKENGLSQAWTGRVFMNPPFSNTIPWLNAHAEHGVGISLVPASVESVVWRKVVWTKAKAILLLHGRTRFCNPDGSGTQGRPLRSVALLAWTGEDALILECSNLAGVFLRVWNQR